MPEGTLLKQFLLQLNQLQKSGAITADQKGRLKDRALAGDKVRKSEKKSNTRGDFGSEQLL